MPSPYRDRTHDIDELNQKVNALRPLSKNLLGQIREYFRIGLTYSSNAIEGNTLTETETKVVLEDGLTIAGKPLRDHFEASGHSEAFDAIFALAKKKGITEKDIFKIHHLFYYRIDEKNAGKYRKEPVVITGTDFVPPPASKVPGLMKKFVAGLKRPKMHPVESAARAHLDLVTIHPFVDGNGRTARLLMNLVLIQSGYTITIIPPVLRADYIALIKRAQTGHKDETDFIHFISSMVYESTKDYYRLLKSLH